MSNEFGYIPESPEQSFGNNKGIFTPTDIYDLTRADKFTQYGQLELLQTQSVSGVSVVDFTSLDENTYNVHFLTFNNVTSTASGFHYHNVRFSNDGGSTYTNATNYDYANQYGGVNAGDFSDSLRSASATEIGDIFALTGTNTEIAGNGYMYFYNLGDSTKYSFTTHHNMAQIDGASAYMYFGSGVYQVAEPIQAFRWFSDSSVTFNGDFSLYGIKEYS